jgi:hypothetical protein
MWNKAGYYMLKGIFRGKEKLAEKVIRGRDFQIFTGDYGCMAGLFYSYLMYGGNFSGVMI